MENSITTPLVSKEIPYVGRDDILEKIGRAIYAIGTRRIVGIKGEGGIGKTRLLEEIHRIHVGENSSAIFITEIIDFDDPSYQIVGNVEHRLAHLLGGNDFDDYRRRLKDLRIIEKTNVGPETLANHREGIKNAFLSGLNRFSTKKRIVIMLDTAEKQQVIETWKNILDIFSRVTNILVLITGRESSFWDEIFKRFGTEVEVISLSPLGASDSRLYLKEKQKKLHITLDPDLSEGLLILTQGRPILLDLAVEWVARSLPNDWIVDLAKEKLSTGDLNFKRKEFERLLVNRVTQIREPMDRLCLLLSRVYPLDATGIAELMRIPQAEASDLYNNALTYVFIKRLTGKRISLHDEMRRMVIDYVWDEVDASKERREHESRLAISYLKKKMDEYKQKIGELDQISFADAEHWADLGILEREYWACSGQYLEHVLFVNPLDGTREFIRLFDMDSRNSLWSILVRSIKPYFDALPDYEKYEVASRQMKLSNETGDFLATIKLGEECRAIVNLEQELDLLTKLANAKIGLGKLPSALEDLTRAQHICETNSSVVQWLGSVLNMLGVIHRIMGHLGMAYDYYTQALKNASSEGQMASTLNNMGYIGSLEGRYRSAVTYCQEGLLIRERLGLRLEEGASHVTMGEIYRNWGKYSDALASYDRALKIFEPENASRWLSRIYSYRGAVYRLLGDYEQAERDLLQSIEMRVPMETPWAFHVLGCVYWNQDKLDVAIKNFNTSYNLARETYDVRTEVNNLVAFAEVYYSQWLKDRGNVALIAKINSAVDNLTVLIKDGYDFSHHYGRIRRVLGDLAFEQKRYQEAMIIYADAYATLGMRTGGYGKRTFLDEIKSLSERISVLAQEDPKEALRWCEYFQEYWTDPSRVIMRKDELVSMNDVHLIELQLRLRK